jgi:hypothetical protein
MLYVENAKSRWFARDLRERFPARPPSISTTSGPFEAFPVEALADPRMDHAEQEWQSRKGEPNEDAERLRREFDSERLSSMWDNLPHPVALVSFHVMFEQTYVSILKDPHAPPAVLKLPVSAASLDRASRKMQAYFSGTGLYGEIDPKRPDRRDAVFLRDFNALRSAFSTVAERLRDCQLIVMTPHQQWHNLPIHALLMPIVWSAGGDPGWTYAPSMGVLDLLINRSRGREHPSFVRAGLTSVPGPGDNIDAFQTIHRRFNGVLASLFSSVEQVFGSEATVDVHRAIANKVVMHHLLAHGTFSTSVDVMNTGLKLAPDPQGTTEHRRVGLLSGMELLRASAAAEHVTVQACSLGRIVTAASDEMWGLGRALIASGADSVLAPLWNIDLWSSSRILSDFYQGWLKDGLPKWRALANAQRRMHDDDDRPDWRHVYHWASFKLIGL